LPDQRGDIGHIGDRIRFAVDQRSSGQGEISIKFGCGLIPLDGNVQHD